ncbi:MAG: hypothetical protein LC096_06115 [Bacteroidia bacterium]|nr:hypothetical protein [Bacteroidia bacterium]
MARYQAVNNLPYIQSSRSGDSYIIDVNGNTIAQNPSEQTRVVQMKLFIRFKKLAYKIVKSKLTNK